LFSSFLSVLGFSVLIIFICLSPLAILEENKAATFTTSLLSLIA